MRDPAAAALHAPPPDHCELTQVITRFHRRFVTTAVRVLGDDEDARDAVQDAYLQAVRQLHQFAQAASLSTWLHRIVVNAALMRLRTRRRRPTEPLPAQLPAADAPSPEVTAHRNEVRTLVRRSLADLGAAHRRVLMLRDIEDRDSDQVACTLGVTPGAVKVRAHRARRALRARLLQLGVVDSPAADALGAAS